MADVADFLSFLREHEGEQVKIEIGIGADDLENHDRQLAKLRGRLGAWRAVDDMDRERRGAAWVPIGGQHHGHGFYVEGDRATDVIVNDRGGKVRFTGGHYVAVVPLAGC